MSWVRRHFLQIDPRTLGVVRIALAALLFLDLGKRSTMLDLWYDNQGLLPNHTMLWRPPRAWSVSFMWTASSASEAAVGLLLCALVYACLLVGYRTRLMQLLALIAVVSLQVRVEMLSNGGDFVLCTLLWWTLFLPLGRRFSLDAVLASLRAQPEVRDTDLAFDRRPARDTTPVESLAVLGFTMQLVVIYFFNAVHKGGPTWLYGEAVHYVLWQERVLTFLGLWARETLPYGVTVVMTYQTLVVEWALPLLLLSPWGRPYTRRVAIAMVFALHFGIQLFANFGLFSPVMAVFSLGFLSAADFDWLAARARRRRPRLLVYFDGECGVCFFCARVLARLDLYERLDLRASFRAEALPAGLSATMLQTTLAVIEPESGRHWERAASFAKVFMALPGGFLLAGPLWLLRPLADRAYDAFARNRTRVSVFFGLAACGVPSAPTAPHVPPATASPFGDLWRRTTFFAREAAVAFLILVASAQVLVENPAVPELLRPDLPGWLRAAVSYTRLQQGWRMFAPEAPTREISVVVDAVTRSGRHVDPLSEVAAGRGDPEGRSLLVAPGLVVYWTSYLSRIAQTSPLHHALRDWLLRYPDRTGNPDDTIVSFEAMHVERASPPPGSLEVPATTHRVFLRYPGR